MAKKKHDRWAGAQSITWDDLDKSGYRFSAPPQAEEAQVPAEPESRGVAGWAKDGGISLLKGAIALPESFVGMADIATGGRVGKALEGVGYEPSRARAILDEYLTDNQKAANAEFQKAEGIPGKFAAAIQNPSVIGQAVIESAPSMLGGAGVARGLLGVAPKMGAVAAGALGEGIVGAGQAAEQIRTQTPDRLLSTDQSMSALASGAGTAVFGALGGKISQRLGIGDVDTMLAQAAVNPVARKGVVRAAIEGFISEGVLEELPQSIQEQVWQNQALGRPLSDGVDEAAVLGLLSGGAMGMVAGPMSSGKAGDPIRDLKTGGTDPLSRAADIGLDAKAKQADAGITEGQYNAAMAAMEGQLSDDQKAIKNQGRADKTGFAGQPAPKAPSMAQAMGLTGDAVQEVSAFADRAMLVKESLADPTTRDFIRQNLGDEAFNEAAYYAEQADRPGDIPDKTRENMLALAEAIISRARLTPITPPAGLGSNVGPALDALGAPQAVPAIGLDTTPTGAFRVDAAGNAAPEVRADVISTRQAQAERDVLGAQARKSSAVPADPAPAQPQAPKALGYDTAPTGVVRVDSQGQARPETRADQINARQSAPARDDTTGQQARKASAVWADPAPKKRETPALGYDTAPTGRMVSGPDGISVETNAERINRQQARSTQPGDITRPGGQPFKNLTAAKTEQRRSGGAVVEVTGGWVVRPQAETINGDTGQTAGRSAGSVGAGSPDAPAGTQGAGFGSDVRGRADAGGSGRADGTGVPERNLGSPVAAQPGAARDARGQLSSPAFLRKTLPEMTEGELTQASEFYGADHPRASKVKQEVEKRERKAKFEAKKSPKPEPVNEQDAPQTQSAPTQAQPGQEGSDQAGTGTPGDGAKERVPGAGGADVQADGVATNQFDPKGLKPGTLEYNAAFEKWSAEQQEAKGTQQTGRRRHENKVAVQKRNGWRAKIREWFLGAKDGDTISDTGTGQAYKVVEKTRRDGTKIKTLAAVDENGSPLDDGRAATGISQVGDRVEGLDDGGIDDDTGSAMLETAGQSLASSLGKLLEDGDAVTTSPSSADVQANGVTGQVVDKRPKARKHPPTVRGSGALADISRALGGLSPDLLSDLSEKVRRTRVSKAGKKTQYTTWDNPAIPGIGPLFRMGGTADLSEVARVLEESGYLEAGAVENDPVGAKQRAEAIIKAELREGGSTLRVGDADAIESEMRGRQEAAMDEMNDPWDDFSFAPEDLDAVGFIDANEDTRAATEQLIAEAEDLGIDTEAIRDDTARIVGDSASQEEYHAATQEAIRQAIAQAGRNAQQADASGARKGNPNGGSPAEQASGTRSQGQRDSGSDQEGLSLTAPTRADIEAQQDRAEQADALDEKAQAKRESEVGDSTFMTGFTGDGRQDNTADLFSQAAQPDAAPEPAESQPITEAEARKRLEWRDMGQRDNTKRLQLSFQDADGRPMTYGTLTKDTGAKAWTVADSDGWRHSLLAAAKKKAEDMAIERLRLDGYVTKEQDQQAATGGIAGATAGGSRSAPAVKQAKPSIRIDDIGEKIGGARKDVWTSFKDDLKAVADGDIRNEPLSKVWPAPDYQKLIDGGLGADAVALVRSFRDEIPAKPRAAWKVKRWAEQVKTLREFANDLLSGSSTAEQFRKSAQNLSAVSRGILGRADLYMEVGHAKSLEGISLAHHHYTLYRGRENVSMWVVERDAAATAFSNWPQEIATGDTKAEAIEAFKKKYATLDAEKQVKKASFDIISTGGKFYVAKKIGRNFAKLAGPFATVKEAREHRAGNIDALEKALEAYKEIPRERRDVNDPRVGEDMRNGTDVTPEFFSQTFGFRGVEFGNWVEQGRRQKDLNDAFDALMDMAAVLGLPPKAISLNGELGLAFGARGGGGVGAAAAHYEDSKVVINLTKKEGAGSLGHEWWHAVDNYFSRMRKQPGDMMTTALDVSLSSRGSDFNPRDGVRREMVQAFGQVVGAIKKTAMKARSERLDAKRSKDYWTTGDEMSARAFESYLIAKLQDQEASNDYLANVVDQRTWDAMAALGVENENSYPYPTADEIPAIREGFDRFFQTVQTREDDAGNVGMFSRQPEDESFYRSQVDYEWAPPSVVNRVKQQVESLRTFWKNSPEVVVLASFADAPVEMQKLNDKQVQNGAVGEPEGFFYKGKAYLLAPHMKSPEDVRRVLFHETLGHLGLRGVFGDRFDGILDQLWAARKSDVEERAAAYGLQVINAPGRPTLTPEQLRTNRRKAAEEVLAKMAETRPEIGFVRRSVAIVKQWLRKNLPGFAKMKMTDAEITANFLMPAQGFIERGQGAEDGQMVPAFSLADEADTGFSRTTIADATQAAMGAGKAAKEWAQSPETKSAIDDLVYVLQDRLIDTKRVVKAASEQIGKLSATIDPYLQEELFHGRATQQTEEFLRSEVQPLLRQMAASNLTMTEVEKYLHARHAPERNAAIAKINPDMPDGGSGMKTAEAKAYMDSLKPQKRATLDRVAARVDAITSGTRKHLLDTGLESAETIASLGDAYKHYVPLQREDVESGGTTTGTGPGFSIKGSSIKRAMGSDKGVVDILANLVMQRERAITRAEKNRVSQALYGLSLKAPNRGFWIAIDPNSAKGDEASRNALMNDLKAMGLEAGDADAVAREPLQRFVDPSTGIVSTRVNPALRSRDNVVSARFNGVDRFVIFNEGDAKALRMAKALKNLDTPPMGALMGWAAKFTRYFAAVNTQYNPVFGIVNLMRDTQGALVNLSTTPLSGKQKEVASNVLPILREVFKLMRARRAGQEYTSDLTAVVDDFEKAGGKTGWRDSYATSQDRAEALKNEIEMASDAKTPKLMVMRSLRTLGGLLTDYNDALENCTRIAAYKVAIEQGLSKEDAASLAKNLTVNFNRKGAIGSQAGALYAFFNASVQGSARLAETLAGPLGKKILKGGILLGVAQAMLLAGAGFDDGEPPDFVVERAFVIPTGDGKYLSIPMPLGLHILPNLGRITTQWGMSDFKDTGKRMVSIMGLLADSFNPIGNAGMSVQTLTPTILDPLVALSENKDFAGRPIARKDFNPNEPTPGFTRAKDTSTWFARYVAEGVNWLTGGSSYKPGAISPTPDQIDYLIGEAGGGVLREASKVWQTAESTSSGAELPSYKIPLVGRLIGDTGESASQASKFYENLKQLNEHEAEIKGRTADGGDVEEYLAENPEAGLYRFADQVQKRVANLRKLKRRLTEEGKPASEVQSVEKRITAEMLRLNERVRAAKAEGVNA